MPDPTPSRTYFENSQPILRVEDMKAALAFYVDKLGFQNASWGTEDFTSVNRDRAGIYLCRGGQGRGGAWVWIGVEDATRLHDELVAHGVAIRMPLTNFNWALEFHVEDPDGNVLRFGSEPLPGHMRQDLPRWEQRGLQRARENQLVNVGEMRQKERYGTISAVPARSGVFSAAEREG